MEDSLRCFAAGDEEVHVRAECDDEIQLQKLENAVASSLTLRRLVVDQGTECIMLPVMEALERGFRRNPSTLKELTIVGLLLMPVTQTLAEMIAVMPLAKLTLHHNEL